MNGQTSALIARYGVFEEHGYPGDTLYPAFYREQTWTAEGARYDTKEKGS